MVVDSSVERFFTEEGLAVPAVPGSLAAALRSFPGSVWGTREPPQALYRLAWWVDEVENGRPDDYLVTGLSGHGIGSTALHYYLVLGRLALLMQLPWRGIGDDPEFVNASLGATHRLVAVTGREPDGPPVIAVVGGFGTSWWSVGGRREVVEAPDLLPQAIEALGG